MSAPLALMAFFLIALGDPRWWWRVPVALVLCAASMVAFAVEQP